jgi:hypothetical protein
VAAGQVEVAADLDSVRQQTRQPGTSRQRQLVRLSALDHRRRVELAVVKAERERDVQRGQIQRSGDRGFPQPYPAAIDLILQFAAAPAKQCGIHGPPVPAVPAVKEALSSALSQDLSLADLVHGMLSRCAGP